MRPIGPEPAVRQKWSNSTQTTARMRRASIWPRRDTAAAGGGPGSESGAAFAVCCNFGLQIGRALPD